MIPVRAIIVIALLFLFALARRLYARWRADVAAGRVGARTKRGTGERAWPQVPGDLLATEGRSWIVFTTPTCASCDAVRSSIAGAEPGSHVVTVDATREPHLADAYGVRSAPTTVLADASGRVLARFVGAAAVAEHLRRSA